MEIAGKVRYYLFDYDEHMRCVEDRKHLQSPLLKGMQVKWMEQSGGLVR